MTNSFMLQNNDSLTCRYATRLKLPVKNESSKRFGRSNPNDIIHILLNIVFYPFVKLKTNKKATLY